MSGLLVRSPGEPAAEGCLVRVTPESARWRHVGFEVFRLPRRSRIARPMEGREVCVVVLTGRADVAFAGREWLEVGQRESLFDGEPPWAVYLPPGGVVEVAAASEVLEVALCWAPATRGAEPA